MAAVKIPYRDIPASRDGNGYITINGTLYDSYCFGNYVGGGYFSDLGKS